MYRLKSSLAVLAIALTGVAHGQEVSAVKTGPDNEQTTKILKVLGENKHGIFYMAAKRDDLYVQRYSAAKMDLAISQKIEIPRINDVTLELEEMFLMDNQILLFATGFDSGKSAFVTYSFVIDERCQIASDGKQVFEMPVEKKRRGGSVEYSLSQDRTRVLIYSKTYLKAKELHRYSLLLLDDKGEMVTEQSFDVPEAEGKELVMIKSFKLDAGNDIHCVVSRSIYDRSAKSYNESFEVISYRKANEYEPTTTKLSLGVNSVISSVVIAARKDGSVAVGGFYIPMKGGKRATGIEGTFYTTIDLAGSAGEMIIQPFSDKFKSKIVKDKKVEKGFDLPLTYMMREAYVTADDDITFIAEDYIYTPAEGAAGSSTYYGYIIAIKVSADGDILWEQVINKRQIYQEVKVGMGFVGGGGAMMFGVAAWVSVTSDKTIYLSYESWSSDGDLVFLFNDDASNKALPVGEKRDVLSRALKGVPMTARITADGDLSYDYADELCDEETVLRPRMSVTQDGKLYFITAKRDVEKVGVATLK
jgi:hypothetical protein